MMEADEAQLLQVQHSMELATAKSQATSEELFRIVNIIQRHAEIAKERCENGTAESLLRVAMEALKG